MATCSACHTVLRLPGAQAQTSAVTPPRNKLSGRAASLSREPLISLAALLLNSTAPVISSSDPSSKFYPPLKEDHCFESSNIEFRPLLSANRNSFNLPNHFCIIPATPYSRTRQQSYNVISFPQATQPQRTLEMEVQTNPPAELHSPPPPTAKRPRGMSNRSLSSLRFSQPGFVQMC